MTDQTKSEFIKLAIENIQGLLEGHINEIADTAGHNEGKCSVAINLVVDLTHKVPAGGVKLSYSAKTVDDAAFHCEDQEQTRLEV